MRYDRVLKMYGFVKQPSSTRSKKVWVKRGKLGWMEAKVFCKRDKIFAWSVDSAKPRADTAAGLLEAKFFDAIEATLKRKMPGMRVVTFKLRGLI